MFGLILFFSYFLFGKSWNDEILTIATEIMFRNLGDTGPSLVNRVLQMVGEQLERPSLAGSWLSYLERPPFNTDCFNHWRYTQKPFGPYIEMHSNEDDLKSTLVSLSKGLTAGTISGAWAYHFSFKTLLCLYLESFSPIHNSEYFGDAFPNGDDSGRKYMIKYNGETMSLHDFWDTGCGQYSSKYPFSVIDWRRIDTEVTNIIKANPSGSYPSISIVVEDIINESYHLSQYVYPNTISPNTELPTEYVDSCKSLVSKRIPLAAYSLAKFLKTINIPNIVPPNSKSPISASEAIAWAVMCFLVPLATFLTWNYFHKKTKAD